MEVLTLYNTADLYVDIILVVCNKTDNVYVVIAFTWKFMQIHIIKCVGRTEYMIRQYYPAFVKFVLKWLLQWLRITYVHVNY